MFDFKKNGFIVYAIVGLILVVCLKIYRESDDFNLKCIISTKDGNKYCVRERERENEAADLLATVTGKCREFVDYMKTAEPNDPRVKKLVKNFNPKKISETLPTSELTAYSENKGEKIAFCLNKSKTGTTLIDINTLMFVALHELTHVLTISIGHKDEFWTNFKYVLQNAKSAGIYEPVDYKKEPQQYCGMTITDNPFYDI
jgi:WLM domain